MQVLYNSLMPSGPTLSIYQICILLLCDEIMTLHSITNCVTNHHSSMAIDCMDSAVRTLQEHFWTYELLHTLWPSQNSWPINLQLNCAQTHYILYKTKYQIMKIKLLVCWNKLLNLMNFSFYLFNVEIPPKDQTKVQKK